MSREAATACCNERLQLPSEAKEKGPAVAGPVPWREKVE